ncbi:MULTISPECIES: CocE/NonD family hydrolase [unclassified Fusibacter]|uniref:CocE/NonD family hydrolase n=1 Tax=unclassified Fusibacter TaxID=2624464 RepID=UPI001010BF2E|nr:MULTISPECIES: CocE/NonD family hydrolase [unclassified Fusibacter]MCK8060628.1 CocE/NonD family hydrolase [Fusibacter sp. A2]NPE22918.1 CocE/NonD family hydrolase [Fusibacter sp. A1]RXV59985.1 CocE/NonD family hydrolase [Fusibacter sp. A1]
MRLDEFQKKSGLEKVPVYWDRRYTKNLDQLSKPLYTVELEENVAITLRDGVVLYADIYRPKELEKSPALLAWSAYGKTMQAMKRGALPGSSNYFDHSLEAGDIDFFVQRGYTFVIPDPRGIGVSEGEFYGIYNPQEQLDCYDVIEWLGSDYPGCDGKVAMAGYSYFGIIQMLVAALKPPHLTCIMPLSYTDDYYQHGYYGGVANTYMSMYWELCPSHTPRLWSEKMYSEKELKERMKEVQKDPDIAIISYFNKMFNTWPPRYHTFYLDYLLHPQDDEFWKQRSAKFIYDQVEVPTYFKCGWAPTGRWSAPVFNAMNSKELSCVKRAGVMESYGGMELPYRFMNEECLRWYDHWMKGTDTGILDEPPFKMNIIGRGYRYESEYPLARTDFRKLYLRTFGQLRWEKDPEGALPPDSFTHRPPNITNDVERLVYRTDRFSRPTEFTGPIELRLFASIDAEDANFIVKLWQITQGGTRMPLCRTGSLKASHPYDAEKSDIGRPVHDHSRVVKVVPGEINEYIIEINPIGMVFDSGTSLEIEIKAMDNFEHQKEAWQGKLGHLGPIPSANTINYKIFRDADYPSYILLPVIPETPSENWLQPIVGSGSFSGSGNGSTH